MTLQTFLYKFLLKCGKNEEDFDIVVKTLCLTHSILNNFHLKLKKIVLLLTQGLKLHPFEIDHIHSLALTLPNLLKLEFEKAMRFQRCLTLFMSALK